MLSRASADELRADLERLMRGHEQPRVAREEIAASWARSLRVGLQPDKLTVPYQPDFDEASRLTWAAQPVLAQLAQEIEGSGIGVAMSDEHGHVIARRADERAVVQLLDRISLAPGFYYGEDSVGTNAIGTAIADAAPLRVFGTEHFAEVFAGMACAASPITGPGGEPVGVVSLACESGHATPLMQGIVKHAAGHIEQQLRADASGTERALREQFAAARRRTRGPLVLLGPATTLANPAAARMLRSADRERLWELIAPVLAGGAIPSRHLQLIDGSLVAIRYKPVGDGDRVLGALVWFKRLPARETLDEPMSASGLPSLTAAERTVADLVAEGLTNHEVAQRLALTPSAVHAHLRGVYGKLGVQSRVQLARALERSAAKARTFAAIDETRRRIERDLQDGVQQRLARVGLSLSLARTSVPPERAALADELNKVAEGLIETAECLRDIYRGVYPAILADKGLRPAIQTLARRFAIPVELDLRLDQRLPQPVEIGIYHLVCEALNNAATHAKASAVQIAVTSSGDFVDVTVRDDGIGGANPNGPELTGLLDRVEAMNAVMRLTSPPGAGTVMRIKVPAKAG